MKAERSKFVVQQLHQQPSRYSIGIYGQLHQLRDQRFHLQQDDIPYRSDQSEESSPHPPMILDEELELEHYSMHRKKDYSEQLQILLEDY